MSQNFTYSLFFLHILARLPMVFTTFDIIYFHSLLMSPAMAMNDERSEDCHAIESEYHKGVKHLYEKGYLHKVPKKYMFPASERPTKSMDDDSNVAKENLQLPIIDFTDLIGPNRLQALESLANACEQYGFFQVGNW